MPSSSSRGGGVCVWGRHSRVSLAPGRSSARRRLQPRAHPRAARSTNWSGREASAARRGADTQRPRGAERRSRNGKALSPSSTSSAERAQKRRSASHRSLGANNGESRRWYLGRVTVGVSGVVILVVLAILFFGVKRLPAVIRAGRIGAKEFKDASAGVSGHASGRPGVPAPPTPPVSPPGPDVPKAD